MASVEFILNDDIMDLVSSDNSVVIMDKGNGRKVERRATKQMQQRILN